MKKWISLALALVLTLSLAACAQNGGNTANDNTTPSETTPSEETAPAAISDSLETMTLDLSDTSEEGTYRFSSTTGLTSADAVSEVLVNEPFIGSIAYSLVLVRVKDSADAKSVAQDMHDGINPRKWVCVEADDLMVVGKADVVMLVMIASDFAEDGVTAQSFVDAFSAACGGLDFTIGA